MGQEVVHPVPCVEERTRDGTLSCEESFQKSTATCKTRSSEDQNLEGENTTLPRKSRTRVSPCYGTSSGPHQIKR